MFEVKNNGNLISGLAGTTSAQLTAAQVVRCSTMETKYALAILQREGKYGKQGSIGSLIHHATHCSFRIILKPSDTYLYLKSCCPC